tara:strand:- start:68 stop:601 length:534 start_codon:yes stop_codon:yes gene_type:complete
MEYAGFWKRFGAYWIDVLCFVPIIAFGFWGNEQSRLFSLYNFVPGLLVAVLFHVYLVKKYGGTPGKLVLKIKITKLDGSGVTYKEAVLRYSVLFVLSFCSTLALILPSFKMTDTLYFSMNWQERALYASEHAPQWNIIVTILITIWVWSEFIVMLTNKKKRALHDFMAGTVVIKNNA